MERQPQDELSNSYNSIGSRGQEDSSSREGNNSNNANNILIFCIISSQLYDLKSHIRFCILFRNKNLITNEEELLFHKVH